jgi:hypothetical protein
MGEVRQLGKTYIYIYIYVNQSNAPSTSLCKTKKKKKLPLHYLGNHVTNKSNISLLYLQEVAQSAGTTFNEAEVTSSNIYIYIHVRKLGILSS